MKTILEILKRKWAEYLLEIIVIIIGIISAFMLNNWHEYSSERQNELIALEALENEFLLNKSLIVDKKNRLIIAIEKYNNFMARLQQLGSTGDDIINFQRNGIGIGGGTTNLSFGVIDALLSSGQINLIRNHSLKFLLTDWKYRSGDFYENELNHLQFLLGRFSDYNWDYIPIEDYSDVPINEIKVNAMILSKKTKYRNYLHHSAEYMRGHILPKCLVVEEMIGQILNLVDGEINKLE